MGSNAKIGTGAWFDKQNNESSKIFHTSTHFDAHLHHPTSTSTRVECFALLIRLTYQLQPGNKRRGGRARGRGVHAIQLGRLGAAPPRRLDPCDRTSALLTAEGQACTCPGFGEGQESRRLATTIQKCVKHSAEHPKVSQTLYIVSRSMLLARSPCFSRSSSRARTTYASRRRRPYARGGGVLARAGRSS